MKSRLGIVFWILSMVWFFLAILTWYLIANGWLAAVLENMSSPSANVPVKFFSKVSDLEYWKNFGYFVGTLGVGPIAIYLASVRTKVAEDQLLTDRSKHETEREKVSNDRIKSVNETFAKSIELLGSKEIAVKQGAIYALARLSKLEKDTLHGTIVKIFVSFVRDQSKPLSLPIHPLISTVTRGDAESETGSSVEIMPLDITNLPVDVETALYAIRDRDSGNEYEIKKHGEAKAESVGYLFDMSNSKIFNADLDKSNFRGFNLSDTSFIGCSFVDANFANANLVSSVFINCTFERTNVAAADLSKVTGLTQQDKINLISSNLTKFSAELTQPTP